MMWKRKKKYLATAGNRTWAGELVLMNLFNIAVNSSGCIVSNTQMNNELEITANKP
jgi:hypothetical protein